MVFAYNLYLIWSSMSAYLFSLEQVDMFGLGIHGELPFSENIILKAMHWLICLDKWV